MAEYLPDIIHINDLQIGAVFDRSFDFGTSYPLAGKSLKMQVRKSWDNPTVILEFSTSDSSISISGNVIRLQKDSSQTQLQPGSYVYDLEAYTDANDHHVIMKGNLTANYKVTR